MIKSRRMRWARHERGEEECVYDFGGKETTRKIKHRWVDDLKMDLR
jgi:hypothetical protein